MKRKIVGVIAALTLTLIGTLILVVYVGGAEDRALAGEQTVDVLVVAQSVKKGTPAIALDGKVRVEHVPVKVRADGAVAELRTLRGLVTTADLVPGEQLIRHRFAKPDVVTTSGIDTSKLVKLSAELDPERVVGGTLRAGDLVAVIASTTESPKVTELIIHQVPVVGVAGTEASKAGDRPSTIGATSKVMVTLALTEPQSAQLVWGLEHGTIWLALEPKDADQASTGIVGAGNLFR